MKRLLLIVLTCLILAGEAPAQGEIQITVVVTREYLQKMQEAGAPFGISQLISASYVSENSNFVTIRIGNVEFKVPVSAILCVKGVRSSPPAAR